MQESFLAFVSDPTPENYLAIRRLVVTHPDYDPYGDGIRQLRDAYEAEEFERVHEVFGQQFVTLLLSGEGHFILSLAHDKLGRNDLAEVEKYLAFTCVRGILETGDGTQERPYLVTSTHDEYDALNALGKTLTMQALHQEPNRLLDHMQVEGGDVWFDITDAFRAMERRMPGG